MTQISDELLMAYIDGQLDKPQATFVNGLLKEDEELVRRVRRLQQTQARFMEAFGAILREGHSGLTDRPVRRQGPRIALRAPVTAANARSIGLVALLIAAAGSAGFAAARMWTPEMATRVVAAPMTVPQAGDWSREMAHLHSFFVHDTVAIGPRSQANPDFVRFQLAKIANKPLAIPDFAKHNLGFQRGALMSYHGTHMMQLAYLGDDAPPVALYVMPGGPEAPATPGTYGKVKTISWSKGGLRFVLAGDLPHDALRALAAVAREQMTNG